MFLGRGQYLSKLYLHLYKDGEYWDHFKNITFDPIKRDWCPRELKVGDIMEVFGGYKVEITSISEKYYDLIDRVDVKVLSDPPPRKPYDPDSIYDPVALAYKKEMA